MINRIMITMLVLLLSGFAVMAEEYDINVKVIGQNKDEISSGTGGFRVKQNDYGQVNITVPDDPLNFMISSLGSRMEPTSFIRDNDNTAMMLESDPWIMVSIYLKPSQDIDTKINLKGQLTKHVKVQNLAEPLYTYSEEKLDFDLAYDEKIKLPLVTADEGRSLKIEISATPIDVPAIRTKADKYVSIKEDYSLINIKNGSAMMSGNCVLGFGGGYYDSGGKCTMDILIPLGENDSLLYISNSKISDLRHHDDGTVTFNLEVSHTYALNPVDYSDNASELKSERTTMVLLNKAIRANPEEKIEIEIPGDRDSQLPFPASELIVLTISK